MTHCQRRVRLAAALAAGGLDALVVSDLVNVRYLSGFTGSNAALLVFAGDTPAVLATDSRYGTQAARQAPDLEVMIERACAPRLVGRALVDGAARIGFESHVVTVDGFDTLSRRLGEYPDASLVRAGSLVEALREVKDAGEVALLRMACEAADAALAALIAGGGLRPHRTEREVARELESLMVDHGADGRAFETIVATGANSAVPHHRPTGAELCAGDFVKIDFGALVGGYHSDMTRTFVLGAPAEWQREVYALVADAQRAGRAALVAGAELREVDAAAREVIVEAGHGDHFGHGLGHGVGLQIHEAPGIGSAATGMLRAGSVVTVEPGVYLPGRGGVRIEDTVLVTERDTDVLTRFPKDFTAVS